MLSLLERDPLLLAKLHALGDPASRGILLGTLAPTMAAYYAEPAFMESSAYLVGGCSSFTVLPWKLIIRLVPLTRCRPV